QVIRVLALGQERETQRLAGLNHRQRQVSRPPGSLETCLIAIEAKDRLTRHAPQKLELVFRQRGAERSDDVLEPGLRQRNHVHVTLDGEDRSSLLLRTTRAGEIVEHVALVKELGVVGVEI